MVDAWINSIPHDEAVNAFWLGVLGYIVVMGAICAFIVWADRLT